MGFDIIAQIGQESVCPEVSTAADRYFLKYVGIDDDLSDVYITIHTVRTRAIHTVSNNAREQYTRHKVNIDYTQINNQVGVFGAHACMWSCTTAVYYAT